MKIVVLAGGRGTRLGLEGLPKPMVPVCGVPLLERIVRLGVEQGLTEFVFLNGHLAHVIEEYFGDGAAYGAQIVHVREPTPLGTAGATLDARALLEEPFIVLYGDILIDIDLRHLAQFAADHGGLATILVHPNDHPYDSDLLETNDQDQIIALHPKPHDNAGPLPNLVSGAIYVLHPDIFDFVPTDRPSDWAKDVFPSVLTAGKEMFGYRSIEYSKDIGTPDRLQRAEQDIQSGRMARMSRRAPKAAIFFDRDGVLNIEKNGIHKPEMLELIPGAAESIRKVNKLGLPAICVTNQPDLAKGFMTFEDLRDVLAALDLELSKEGAFLDDVFYCPHHPEVGWPGEVQALKVLCECRKPAPGMLIKAAAKHNLDLSRSWLIGDAFSDVAAASAVGVSSVLVKTGRAGSDRALFSVQPTHVVEDISEAVNLIVKAIL